MQIHYTGYRIRGGYRVAHLGHVWEMTSKHAQHRLAILAFAGRHGKIAASEAFTIPLPATAEVPKALDLYMV